MWLLDLHSVYFIASGLPSIQDDGQVVTALHNNGLRDPNKLKLRDTSPRSPLLLGIGRWVVDWLCRRVAKGLLSCQSLSLCFYVAIFFQLYSCAIIQQLSRHSSEISHPVVRLSLSSNLSPSRCGH